MPILLITILLLIFYGISQSQSIQDQLISLLGPAAVLQPTETRLPNCVPYTSNSKAISITTATPYLGEQSNSSNFITVTPRPISNTYDLSPNSQAIDKEIILVFRCDGSFVQFIIGPGIKIPQDLQLGVGDTIINSYPIGNHPMPLPPPSTLMATQVVASKPGITTTPFKPTDIPYPAPHP
jgi:hypothetical protein